MRKIYLIILIFISTTQLNAILNSLLYCRLHQFQPQRDAVLEQIDNEIKKLKEEKQRNISNVQKINEKYFDESNSMNAKYIKQVKEFMKKVRTNDKLDMLKYENKSFSLNPLNGGPFAKEKEKLLKNINKQRDKILAEIQREQNNFAEYIDKRQNGLNDYINTRLNKYNDFVKDYNKFFNQMSINNVLKELQNYGNGIDFKPQLGIKLKLPNMDICNLDQSTKTIVEQCKEIQKAKKEEIKKIRENLTKKKIKNNKEEKWGIHILGKGKTQKEIEEKLNNKINSNLEDIKNINNKIDNKTRIFEKKLDSIETDIEEMCDTVVKFDRDMTNYEKIIRQLVEQYIKMRIVQMITELLYQSPLIELQKKLQCSITATVGSATNPYAIGKGYASIKKCLETDKTKLDSRVNGKAGTKSATYMAGFVPVYIPVVGQPGISGNLDTNALSKAAQKAETIVSCLAQGASKAWITAYDDCMSGTTRTFNFVSDFTKKLKLDFLDDIKNIKKMKCIMDKKVGEEYSTFSNLKEVAGSELDNYLKIMENIKKKFEKKEEENVTDNKEEKKTMLKYMSKYIDNYIPLELEIINSVLKNENNLPQDISTKLTTYKNILNSKKVKEEEKINKFIKLIDTLNFSTVFNKLNSIQAKKEINTIISQTQFKEKYNKKLLNICKSRTQKKVITYKTKFLADECLYLLNTQHKNNIDQYYINAKNFSKNKIERFLSSNLLMEDFKTKLISTQNKEHKKTEELEEILKKIIRKGK